LIHLYQKADFSFWKFERETRRSEILELFKIFLNYYSIDKKRNCSNIISLQKNANYYLKSVQIWLVYKKS